jgi:ATP-dependent Lhr-like helicase
LVELICAHRSTMVFVNSRRLAERIAQDINDTAGAPIALAHHGSLAREERSKAEEQLKRGELPCVVATASLELGLDIGAVDLVIQIESPPSVAAGLQRVGRSNHEVGGVPHGVIMPKHKADLLAAAAAVSRMRALEVEETRYPKNPLDVLAQHIVAMVAMENWPVEALFERVRQCANFADLPRSSFEGVVDMLSGRYPSTEFSDLRPRLVWDRVRNVLRARKGTRLLAVTNVGTIPERGLYTVVLDDGTESKKSRRVGELDEEMVFELREGEVVLLGASSWRVQRITHERVFVVPAPGEPGKMPFWHGDSPGRSPEFGASIGALARELSKKGKRALSAALDDDAQAQLLQYVGDQLEQGVVPTDRHLVVERMRDELGDYRVCLLSPYGKRVHIPLAMCMREKARAILSVDIEPIAMDDGIAMRFPDLGTPPDVQALLPAPHEVHDVLVRALGDSSLFAARFREAAGRALLLPKRRPGMRTPLWAQRKRAGDLLQVASKYPQFPIVLETYRECMSDVFDVPFLQQLLVDMETGAVRLQTIDTQGPSPFASSVLFSYMGNFIYDGDLPLAERRAQALTIDQKQLRELLGNAALRELLDPGVLHDVERSLQRADHEVDSADALHDLLRVVGDLSPEELALRPGNASAHVQEALRERRVLMLSMAGQKRVITIEDAGLYEQAVGATLPTGVPQAYRSERNDALGELLRRYSKTRGPFTEHAFQTRYALSRGSVHHAVEALVQAHVLLRGEFLPGGTGLELCDAEVLGQLKRRTLAVLRSQVEPVAPAQYAAFLPAFHGIGEPHRDTFVGVLDKLQGYPFSLSDLEEAVLPARLPGFRPSDLDAAVASGAYRWVGVGASDQIALYAARALSLLAPPVRIVEGDLASFIRSLLSARGASFFHEIIAETQGFPGDIAGVLWDMVQGGELTNDTLAPLRERSAKKRKTRPGRAPRGPMFAHIGGPPGTQGRWSLVPHHPARAPSLAGPGKAPVEGRLMAARLLLARYGVLTREAVSAEGWEGGFQLVYPVLKQLEERGELRRGMFIDGLGATQFSLSGTDDRLRATVPTDAVIELAARDPANAYGAVLPWPGPVRPGAPTPQRAQGCRVFLRKGELLAFQAKGGDLITFEAAASSHARTALALAIKGDTLRTVQIPQIDGEPAGLHPLARALLDIGFSRVTDGLTFVPPRKERTRLEHPETSA